jgi:acetyl esterase/lipase
LALLIGSPALTANNQMPALAVYGGLPGVEDMSISPDGKHIAAIARVKGERHVLITNDKQELLASAPVGDAKLRGLGWVGPRVLLVTTSATAPLGPGFTTSHLELWGVIRLSLDGAKPEMVFKRNGNMANAVWGSYGARNVGGKSLGYFGGVELKKSADGIGYIFDHGRPALFEVDLATMRTRKAANAPGEGTDREWLVDATGEVAATLDVRSGGAWKIEGAGGRTIASGTHPGGKVGLVAFGKDGTSLIYSEESNVDGVVRWFEVPLAGGTAQEVFADIGIDRLYVDPASGRILGYRPDDEAAKPVMFDPAHQKQVDLVFRAFPKLDLRLIEWSPDFGRFLVHASGNANPGTWYVVDMTSKRADPVGDDYPQISSEAVGPISTVAYRAGDGMELDGILTLPPGRPARGLPAIMLPHGGPHSRDRARFDWWAQAFASRGYAVFQPNFRGSTNRDDNFRRAGYGQWGRKMQTDVSDGLAELARQGIIDPRRVCIVGASYGGYAALAGVTLQKGIYRCAVSVAGVSDLADMFWTDYRESGGNRMLKRNLTESLGPPSTFAEVSPRKRAREADAPILLIHGRDDTVVPYKQSTAMADALKDAGKPVELVELREEDHWLSRGATRRQMLEAAVGFVARHNPAD